MPRAYLKLLLLLVSCVPTFAGLSLVLTPGVQPTVKDPSMTQQQPWRVEFQMHGWTTPNVPTNIWDMNGIAAMAELLPQNLLRFIDKRDGVAPSVCDLTLGGYSNVLVRLQRDPANMRMVCELWKYDGSAYQRGILTITGFNSWAYSDGKFGDAYTSVSLGFFRVFSTLLPDGSRAPVSASSGDVTDLKFDGNTSDHSGNGHNLIFPGAGFTQTPNQGPISIIRTDGAPAWSNWVSLRAGYPATLDGSASFSLADATSAVSYQWQQVSGPSTLRWSSRSIPKPTVTGLIFGTYRFRLLVTDAAGKTSVSDLDVGSVATDDNGVVIQSNPAADAIFGPMIAFGKNPWQYQDYIALHSAQVRSSYIQSISPPTWINNLSGAIDFTPYYGTSPNQTGLASSLAAADMSIHVLDATKLDLSVFPTVIQIDPFGTIEEVRICSSSGNTLNVCFDGRGWRQGLFSEVASPQPRNAGVTVTQLKTTGHNTSFLSDFCPAGPGEEGQIYYATGNVSVTANSNVVIGSGTTWTDPNLVGRRIRIAGHHGGVPFFFFAAVTAVNSPTSLTLSRSYPEQADTEGSVTYAVIIPGRYIARNWLRADGSTGQQLSGVSSCESDTQMYQASADAIANNNTAPQRGQHYSYSATTWLSEFGPNYYDEVLAHYASYYRSGYSLFLNNARGIGDYWAGMPELDEGYYPVTPRHAGLTGMVAGAVLDGRVNNWRLIRKLANSAVAGEYSGGAILSSCDTDVREDAYGLSWIALAAIFDPVDTGNPSDPNQRSYWRAQLDKAYVRDRGCLQNNVFSQPFYSGNMGTYSMVHGSATVTGSAVAPALCPVSGIGTVSVSNGSVAASGTGFVQDQKIVIKAIRNGQPYLFYSLFTKNSPSSLTLSTPFDGDSGDYLYQIESDLNFLAFAADATDHTNLNTFYACQQVDAMTITLDRPWSGATGSFNASRAQSTYVGFGATPFQNGIKALAMRYAALGATGATAFNYSTMANSVANWILTEGFDPATGGLYYARGFYNCEPPGFNKIGCDYGPTPDSKVAARTLSGEAQNAMSLSYQASPTTTSLAFGDQFYGSQWGKPGFGNPPFSDGIYLSTLDSDATFAFKWIGFLFGIGMSHQWPAIRLGGRQAPENGNASIAYNASAVPRSASVKILVTQPSGIKTLVDCSASPCQIPIDRRQGSHWYQIAYFDTNGKIVSQSQAELLEVR